MTHPHLRRHRTDLHNQYFFRAFGPSGSSGSDSLSKYQFGFIPQILIYNQVGFSPEPTTGWCNGPDEAYA